ncbi:MAG: DinB family protein [Deinococcota bacterium]
MRPQPNDYPPRYQRYLDAVPETDILAAFDAQQPVTTSLLSQLSEQQSLHRYQPDKWSIREVLGHIIDVERIFSLRVIRFSRGDGKPRQDFDFNKTAYVRAAGYHQRELANISQEFYALRNANMHAFKHLSHEQLQHIGEANHDQLSVLALLFVMLGHERHHLQMIRTNYLNK